MYLIVTSTTGTSDVIVSIPKFRLHYRSYISVSSTSRPCPRVSLPFLRFTNDLTVVPTDYSLRLLSLMRVPKLKDLLLPTFTSVSVVVSSLTDSILGTLQGRKLSPSHYLKYSRRLSHTLYKTFVLILHR